MAGIPSLSDESPWAQGFNDWLAFGKAACAFSAKMDGFEEYIKGKRDAELWFKGELELRRNKP